MAHFTDAVDVKIKYNFATLWDIASSKRSFSFNEINSAIDNTDISQLIQYGNNKLNICHFR